MYAAWLAVAWATEDGVSVGSTFAAVLRGNGVRVLDATPLPQGYLRPVGATMRRPNGVGLPAEVPAEIGRWLAIEAWSRTLQPGPGWTQAIQSRPGVASGWVFDETTVARAFDVPLSQGSFSCVSRTFTSGAQRTDSVGASVYTTDAAVRWGRILGQTGRIAARWDASPDGSTLSLSLARGSRVPGTGMAWVSVDLRCTLRGYASLGDVAEFAWQTGSFGLQTWTEVTWRSPHGS